jgi:hexosaminidase
LHTDPITLFKASQPIIEHRSIHLDLKGVPPTPERLLSLLDVFAAMRFNSVLVEWEDMFPWTCDPRFRCATAYTPEQVRAFLNKAQELGIEVIPLVQSLGHMETPLKFPEYAHMREVPDDTGGLNPLAPGARELVQRMVDDVLALMPDIRHFHLGGDEAWAFGTHADTKAYIAEHGKGALYMYHMEPLLDHLLAKGIRPILWHDMMTGWDTPALMRLKDKADLCVWGYQRTPDTVSSKAHCHIDKIRRFAEHGITLWGGTAYKGGDGAELELPVVANRLENYLGWCKVASEQGMKGVFVTAWSRYNSLNTQLSPIDAALDVMALAAVVFHDGTAPESSIDACRDFLKQIGEYERFQRCYTAMEQLSSLKLTAWEHVRCARTALACLQLDPTRWDKTVAGKHLRVVKNRTQDIVALTPEIIAAFSGLVPEHWMTLYVGDRRMALEQEAQEISRLISAD